MTTATATATAAKPKSKRTYKVPRLNIIIDLGNGRVQALIRRSNEREWKRLEFRSCLAEVEGQGIQHEGRWFVCGNEAKIHGCPMTGDTVGGKAEQALPLLLWAISQSGLEFSNARHHCEVVFTSPSNKAYGADIKNRLDGEHEIFLPSDDIDGKGRTLKLSIMSRGMLECHRAINAIPTADSPAVLIDVGHRTVIVSRVSPRGKMLARLVSDDCGVGPIIDRLMRSDDKRHSFGLGRLPSADKVKGHILESKGKEAQSAIASVLQSDLKACMGEAKRNAEKLWQDGDRILLIGGGAKLPGIRDVLSFGGVKVRSPKDADWLNILGIAHDWSSFADSFGGATNE